MASNIVPGNIDGTYPKAGQDNSSQGLRDNFSSTKNNFTEAKTEIEDLQTNKANLNSANNFSGNTIQNAVFKDNSETVKFPFDMTEPPSDIYIEKKDFPLRFIYTRKNTLNSKEAENRSDVQDYRNIHFPAPFTKITEVCAWRGML